MEIKKFVNESKKICLWGVVWEMGGGIVWRYGEGFFRNFKEDFLKYRSDGLKDIFFQAPNKF